MSSDLLGGDARSWTGASLDGVGARDCLCQMPTQVGMIWFLLYLCGGRVVERLCIF
jgi:hypothetical protein